MLDKETLRLIEIFDDFLLKDLTQILTQLKDILLDQEDHLDRKVISLHRLYLSYVREYRILTKKLTTQHQQELEDQLEDQEQTKSETQENTDRHDSPNEQNNINGNTPIDQLFPKSDDMKKPVTVPKGIENPLPASENNKTLPVAVSL